jgi:hypothetical protein
MDGCPRCQVPNVLQLPWMSATLLLVLTTVVHGNLQYWCHHAVELPHGYVPVLLVPCFEFHGWNTVVPHLLVPRWYLLCC